MSERTVFIPNKSNHDFSQAEEFGRLVYVTSGVVSRLNVAQIEREVSAVMAEAKPDDYIMIASLPIIVSVMVGTMAARFSRINLLLYRHGRYVERCVEF